MPSMLMHQAMDHGEAEPRALAEVLGGEERSEQPVEIPVPDSGAVVMHRKLDK